MRFSIFWNFTQRILVVSSRRFEINDRSHLQGSSSLLAERYWRFGKTYRPHLPESSSILALSYQCSGTNVWCHCLKTGPICCTETSVTQSTLLSIAEVRRSQSVVTWLQLLIKQRQTGTSTVLTAETHWSTCTRLRALSRFVTQGLGPLMFPVLEAGDFLKLLPLYMALHESC